MSIKDQCLEVASDLGLYWNPSRSRWTYLLDMQQVPSAYLQRYCSALTQEISGLDTLDITYLMPFAHDIDQLANEVRLRRSNRSTFVDDLPS